MSKSATLVFNDFTCVDHARIDSAGKIIGGSYMLSVILTGTVQAGEEVVIDFSKGKKMLKSAIDDQYNGFDHKLWLCLDSNYQATVDSEAATVKIETPALTLGVTTDSVRFIAAHYGDLEALQKNFAEYLEGVLNAEQIADGKPNVYAVKCILSPKPLTFSPETLFTFRYAHGLPRSSSYGCQNIAHGHLSYFMLLDENHKPLPYEAFSKARGASQHMLDMAMKFDGMYFVHRENVVSEEDGVISVKYSAPRGDFEATFGKDCLVTILDTDTTIEHLIEHMRPSFEFFKQIGAKYLLVSEGLAKGSITEI